MDSKGNLLQLPMNLLLIFMSVTFFIALIPGFAELINMAQQSDSLNCVGYVYDGIPLHPLSYNATIGTQSSMGCMAIKLYLPYLVLGVLIASVAYLFMKPGQQDQMYG